MKKILCVIVAILLVVEGVFCWNLNADLKESAARVDELTAKVESLEAEKTGLTEKVAELEAAQTELTGKNETATADLAAAQAELETVKADQEAAKAALEAAKAELETAKYELANAKDNDIVILYTNDVHTYIDSELSYDVIAAVKKDLQETYANVLLVDAGDHLQGTAYGSMDKGETVIKLMNAAGYDVATMGNHEFDYGMLSALNAVQNWAQFPYVSANFYNELDGVRGEEVLDAYVMFEMGGQKLAIVGVTTPETFTKSTPAYFQNEKGEYIYGISGGEDGAALYADVQTAIDEAKAEGATIVVGLGHLGDDPASKPWTSEETIAAVTGLDAFIDGHSHSTVEGKEVADKNGETVLLTSTGEYFGRIGMMVIDDKTGAITTDFIELVELTDAEGNTTGYELASELYAGTELISDADVKAIKDAWMTEIDTALGVKIGETALTLDNYDENGQRLVRSQETNTGDFCADALYYLFDNMGLDVDVAIMNGGGIRNKAVTGEISYKTAKTIHTFGNVACLQTITGQQLLDALEWGARGAGTGVEVGGFLQVSGVNYTVDSAIADGTQKDEKGVWIGGPAEYRVKDVTVYNKETNTWEPLDLTAQYNMAGYNYTLRDLGDGFAMFDGAINVLDYVMEDYMVLANYIQGFEGGVVEATNSPLAAKYPGFAVDYGTINGTGRITVITAAEEVAEEDKPITLGGLENNKWFTKYGNIYVDCKAEDFLGKMGFAQGDLVTVKFLNQELVLPVVPTYSYVDSGKPAVIVGLTDTGAPTGYVSMAINMGNFGQTYGIATKNTDADGNWFWTANEGVTFPVEFTFEMAEQGGYMAEYILHELNRTNNREDYAALSDEDFANTRVIKTTGLGEGKLVRTSSPINPELGRNVYADAAIKAAGVTVIMNLADSEDMAKAYEGFADTYYAGQKVIYLNLGVDFAEPSFQEGLAKGLRFFAENEGVYAVHCTEGKDRAGFVSALLSCLMGGTYQEVVGDYMTTYVNYYGVENETEKYNAIAESNIIKTLQNAFGVEDLPKADLAAEAAEYLAQIGLTEAEIAALKANLD